jgi:hypothetical protein
MVLVLVGLSKVDRYWIKMHWYTSNKLNFRALLDVYRLVGGGRSRHWLLFQCGVFWCSMYWRRVLMGAPPQLPAK